MIIVMNDWFKIIKVVIAALAVVIISYVGFSIISFLIPNPFLVAKQEAQMLGNWEVEQVQFRRGHYQYNPFGSTVEAELRIQTDPETISTHIKLSHSPLIGWVVDDFRTAEGKEGAFIPQSSVQILD